MELKIGIVTDTHVGPVETPYDNLLTQHSLPVLKRVVEGLAQCNPDRVFQLGDLIQEGMEQGGSEPHQAKVNLDTALSVFSSLRMPLDHVIGNHDTFHLNEIELSQLLLIPAPYREIALGQYVGLVLYSKDSASGNVEIPIEQVQWLKQRLASEGPPVVIFVHHALADQDLTGNYFEKIPHRGLIANRSEVRKIISESGRVVAVVNGHLHWNHFDIHDGIPYVTVQSTIEDAFGDGTPPESFAIMRLKDTTVEVEIFGAQPERYFHCTECARVKIKT